ncbi:MAG: thiamine-phosphate kinase [ANME-2 cluster archaeon]|nr:thiamine-phosphate kinase [ANME-2 cluster archaeon]MBC2701265.1 thiamine-phosphate kinase [ANME-2 cluster archaeon]MBC2708654.1 thiamine-phosphate kinase [ANME-2 cluster archaeon]MBC2748634.1 thiamine-phosphate kinase [ANME-2 cluster archaeon]MBC2762292.1 thiamine-phosphate kinase [ANME-2 cluster archaeon]
MTVINKFRERDIISLITELLEAKSKTGSIHRPVVGPGNDDCAVIDIGDSGLLVATTDMLHKKADFPLGMTPYQMGWMSIAVNLSDIAAMGARPIGIMTALGLPSGLEVNFVKELVSGMSDCACRYGTQIIGGDVDRHDELTIVGSALGMVDAGQLVMRKGAKPGDLVCVTGELGTAGAALEALQQGRELDPEVLEKFYMPVPRIAEGMALAGSGCLTSMMDISDGLALSVHDLAAASGVGFHIKASDIPVHRSVRYMAPVGDMVVNDKVVDDKVVEVIGDMVIENKVIDDKVFEWSVYTGGDFELLFTLNTDCLEKAEKVAQFRVIGKVTASSITIEHNGHIADMEPRGFQQFGDKV